MPRALICIALLTFTPGHVGGSETYVRSLARELGRAGSLTYSMLLPAASEAAVEGLPSTGAGLRSARTRRAVIATALADPGSWRAVTRAGAVHYPLTAPLPPSRRPAAVTLHDVQHLDLPVNFNTATRAYRRLAYDAAARRATLVIVPSRFVRDRAVARLGLDPHRIRVVNHGIDHARLFPTDRERERFLLYPAKRWPHKNHARLFEAFALLRRARPELRLVLTGGRHDALPDGVEQHGFVSDTELAELYRRAAAVVFPSRYEGFGQPPLEAMACGCPVACSNAAALPELVGDAARLFEPDSPRDIVAAVGDVLDDPDEWRKRGLKRAARFTWERSAREHDEVYRELLER